MSDSVLLASWQYTRARVRDRLSQAERRGLLRHRLVRSVAVATFLLSLGWQTTRARIARPPGSARLRPAILAAQRRGVGWQITLAGIDERLIGARPGRIGWWFVRLPTTLQVGVRRLGRAVSNLGRGDRWRADPPWPQRLRQLTVGFVGAGVIGVVVLGMLLHHGASILVGASGPALAAASAGPPRPELADAPTVAVGGGLTAGFSLPPGQVALTFDDGPHPVWTPLILDELDRLGVLATFFVVGEQVQAHPHLARAIVDGGHEIANHTHTHPRMGDLSSREIRLQLDLARLALVEATGIESDLYRPPYSGSVARLDPSEASAAELAVDYGYTLVTTDRTPRDFDAAVDVDQLVASALPPVGSGAVITLHDGGGDDRSRTVEMLDPLVRTLRDSGYEIVTVGDVVAEATGTAPTRPAGPLTRQRAVSLGWLVAVAGMVERVAVVGALTYAGLYVARFGLLFVLASKDRRRARTTGSLEPSDPFEPPVTVIVPVYNEEVGIQAAIRSIDATAWPNLEILVVDDGSTDQSARLAEAVPSARVRVLRKRNGGKASALNFGIAQASHDIVVLVDGDTILEPGTVAELVKPFVDPTVGAVAGNPKIGNVTNLVTRLQVSEYLISSSLERRILAPAGMITTIPGAVGAWRRAAIQEAGLVSEATLAEDTDLTVALARGGWRIAYAAGARAWTEAPTSIGALYRQRTRWTFGTLQVLWRHRRALIDRGAGSRLGRAALPYMFVTGYLLAAIAPLMDLVVLAHLLGGRWQLAVVAWAIIGGVGAAAGVVAARLDGERLRPALLVPVQQLLFRPLLHAVSVVSLRRALMGDIQAWGVQRRVGGLRVGGGVGA